MYNIINQKISLNWFDRAISSSKPQYMQWPSLSFVHMVRKPIWWHEKMSLRHLIVYIKYISHSLNSFFLLVKMSLPTCLFRYARCHWCTVPSFGRVMELDLLFTCLFCSDIQKNYSNIPLIIKGQNIFTYTEILR